MGRSSRTKILTSLVIAVVFGSGFAVGLAVDRTAVANPAPADSVVAEAEAKPSERRTPMYEQVGPAPEQKVLIDSIVLEYREKSRALRAESRRLYEMELDLLVDSTRQAIKQVFTAEQAARYDSLVAEYDRRQAEERATRDDN